MTVAPMLHELARWFAVGLPLLLLAVLALVYLAGRGGRLR